MFRCTNVKINFREKEKEVLDQILGNAGRYDARIRPSGMNGTGEETFLFVLVSRSVRPFRSCEQSILELLNVGLMLLRSIYLRFYVICCLSVAPDGPAIVRVNLFVRSIATISDIKMVSAASSSATPCSRVVYL